MSPSKDQEYFSDGIAEEILNALARIEGLRVAGRTSSFSFKDKHEDLRSISQKLNVRHVLEGSVRRAGCERQPGPRQNRHSRSVRVLLDRQCDAERRDERDLKVVVERAPCRSSMRRETMASRCWS